MTDTAVAPSAVAPAPSLQARPFLPVLVLLFIGSGCAALIYEIVWLQMLGLEIGGSAISLGVLLGTFMGGMCIGSFLFSRLVSRAFHPMLVYAVLELLIGVIGLLELWLIPSATGLYVHFAEPGAGAIALRATIAGICLLPPTILMGATLPAIARYVESSPQGVSWMGFFYGGNIVGAVCGCMWAGFVLLPNHDVRYATYVAFGLNITVAALAILLSVFSEYQGKDEKESPRIRSAASPDAWTVYLAIGLSGLTGLGSEVVWTRQLSLMLGATVFTFSNILSVFLLGLGIGSSVGAFIARSTKEPRVALAWCQLLLAGAIAWAAYSISYSMPFWPIDPRLAQSPIYTFQVNLAACFWALLPGALLWGASFPIALAAIARNGKGSGQDPGRLVGSVYAANTVGAIVGSILFSMVFMQYIGSQGSQRLLIGLCVISGIIAIVPVFKRLAAVRPGEEGASAATLGATLVGLFLAVLVAIWLMVGVSAPNWGAVAWGRASATNMPWLYPPVLTKELPLDAVEEKAIEEAGKLDPGFKTFDVDRNGLVYTLDPGADKEKIEAFLNKNEKALVSAMRKRAEFTAEYAAVKRANEFKRANARYVRNIELANGDLRFTGMDGGSADETAANQRRANELGREFFVALGDQRADLIAALQKRLALTGSSSILPYNINNMPDRYCVYMGEGMNVSVAVTYDNYGYKYFHGAGKVQASSNPEDMRLQRTLGHITALSYYAQTKETPKDVLVVACGAGVTAGSFVPYGSNITIVDIERMVPRYVTPQFWDMNHDVIPPEWSGRPSGYKKTNIVIDDGRHYIKTVNKKFDVITSDPIDPWVKGCAALNTIEYYEMCKAHLKPGGIMALWIPLYESSEDTSKSIIATFFKVFPNGIIWSNDQNGQGYDCTLFGSVGIDGSDAPLALDIDALQDYLDDPNHQLIKRSLQDVGYGNSGDPGRGEAVDLLATYAGSAPRMLEWTRNTDHLINRDRNLRLQYVAGMSVNEDQQVRIFNNILSHYSWPDEILVKGKPERIEALKEQLRRTGRVEQTRPGQLP